MKSKNKKRFWGLFCGYLISILFLTSGLVLSVTSALSLATINAGGKFNFIVPVPDESVYTGILKFYDPDSTAFTISVCADPSTKSNSSYPSEVEIPSKIKVNDVTYTITIVGSFSGCSNLQSITIPDSATTINSSIYSSTTGAGVTDSLGAFENCTNLQSINIPSGIQSIATGSFSGCTGITTMTVASENTKYYSAGNAIITKADKTLVAGCKNTVIPNNVIRIGDRAFRKISNLTSITIPTSVKTLGSSAFAFSGLTSVSVPSGVTSIASNAFACCTSLGSISVDSANTKYKGENNAIIEKSTNKLIVGCKNTVIPSDVKEIGSYAFQGHPITSVTIPASTTIINPYAFLSCSNLTSVTFEKPYGWKAGDTEVDVSESTSQNATWLKETYSGLAWIQSTPTEDDYSDFIFTFDDTAMTASVKAKDFRTISGDKVIPKYVAKSRETTAYLVTAIDEEAFYLPGSSGATNLTGITLPNSIITIGANAFRYSSLTEIVIPDSVTSIGAAAFAQVTTAQSLTLGNKVETIDNGAFNKIGASSVFIPASVKSIGKNPFGGLNNCTSLTVATGNTVYRSEGNCLIDISQEMVIAGIGNSTIPTSGVSSIGPYAFSQLTSLSSITIPSNITTIGLRAFQGCTSLASITLGENLTTIGERAFYNDSALTSITIPANVKTIEVNAFQNTGLTSATFEDPVGWKAGDVAIYPSDASQNATYLKSTYATSAWTKGSTALFTFTYDTANKTATLTAIDSSVTKAEVPSKVVYGGATYTVTKIGGGSDAAGDDGDTAISTTLTSITLPNSIVTISDYAFVECSGLTSISIPSSVKEIGVMALAGTGLTSITIPNNVTSLGYGVLGDCRSLITVSLGTGITELPENCFADCSVLATVNIPTSVTLIGVQAFAGCSKLTTITIPSSVTSIGARAFAPSGLTSATIQTKTGHGWKAGDTLLDVSTPSQNATWLANSNYSMLQWTQFLKDEDFYSDFTFTFNDTAKTASVKARDVSTISGNKEIPSKVVKNGTTTLYTVTEIDVHGFDNATKLTGITIPESITTIYTSSFFNCSGLESIKVAAENTKFYSYENGLYSKGKNVLVLGCKNTVIKDSTTAIGIQAFQGCTGLKSITIPSGVTSIGTYAFRGSGLIAVTFEKAYGWKAGDDYVDTTTPAPQSAEYLTKTYNDRTWTWVDKNIFSYDYNTTNYTAKVYINSNAKDITGGIIIPAKTRYSGNVYNVTSVKQEGFNECRNMARIILPEGLTTIEANAFKYCNSVTSLNVPATVTNILPGAMNDMWGLETLTVQNGNGRYFASGNTIVEGATMKVVQGCPTSVIPEGALIIGEGAFGGIQVDVTLPSTITAIETYAFGWAGFESFTIPASVTRIDAHAFEGAPNLTSVSFEDINGWTVSDGTNKTTIEGALSSSYAAAIYLTGTYMSYTWTKTKVFELFTFEYNDSFETASVSGATTSESENVGDIAIPSMVYYNGKFYNVTSIRSFAAFQASIDDLFIPASITGIVEYAFAYGGYMSTATFEKTKGWFDGVGNAIDSARLEDPSTAPSVISEKYANGMYRVPTTDEYPKLTFSEFNDSVESCSVSAASTTISGEITIPQRVCYNQKIYYVYRIVDNGFKNCKSITNIDLTDASYIKTIGASAFQDCTRLSSVTIGTSLKYIPEYCFAGCTALKSITIPSGILEIGKYAFSGTMLTSATFEDTESWCCRNGTNTITSITVTNASTNAIYLKSTYVAYSWERVAQVSTFTDFKFSNYDSTAKTCSVAASGTSISGDIRIPGRVKYYNSGVYEVKEIVAQGFKDCSKVTGIYIPSTINSIGNYAFSGTSLETIEVALGNSTYKSVGPSGRETNSIIEISTNTLILGCKNTIIDSSVIKIGYGAFRGQLVENITIPENVKIIDEWAFYQTSQLNSVNVMGAVEIKYGAFAESAIQSIYLPSTLVVIEERAFMNSFEINNVVIPASVANIGVNAFATSDPQRSSALTSVRFEKQNDWYAGTTSALNLSNSTTNATYLTGTYKDYEWVRKESAYSSLTFTNYNSSAKTCSVKAKSTSIFGQIVIPNKVYYSGSVYTVTKIDVEGFKDCANVTSVIIPSTVTELGVRSFQSCKMSSLTLIEGLKIINDDALKATNIESLYIPSTVTSIITAFVDNPQLSKMEVDGANTTYYSSGNCIIEKSNMKVVGGCYNSQIPYGVKIIGAWAFSGKHTLTSITLPSTVTRIEKAAFGWSALTSITIPANVTFIQGQVFAGCTQLSSVTFKNKSGWRVDGVGSISVTNATQNATWIKHGGLYSNQDWTRS